MVKVTIETLGHGEANVVIDGKEGKHIPVGGQQDVFETVVNGCGNVIGTLIGELIDIRKVMKVNNVDEKEAIGGILKEVLEDIMGSAIEAYYDNRKTVILSPNELGNK